MKRGSPVQRSGGCFLRASGFTLLTLTLFLIFGNAGECSETQVRTWVDKTSATLEDRIVLTVSVSGRKRVGGEPQLPPLRDFNVTEGGTSSRTEIVNGKMSSSVEHNYFLLPHRTGTFTIGSVRVEERGRSYQSSPIQVKILPAAVSTDQRPPVFITQEVDSESPYVHQQVVYTFRFFQRAQTVEAHWEPPSFQGFWVEDLGKERQYESILEGQRYSVTEIKKALFPVSVGTLKIPQSLLTCSIIVKKSRQRSPRGLFDDNFFSTSLFGRMGQTETKNLRAEPIRLTVRSLPVEGWPADFEGLVGSFRIRANVGETKLSTGDSTTLTVTVDGEGNLRDLTHMPPEEIPGFKIYPDKPSFQLQTRGDIVESVRVFKKALVPLEAGSLEVPGLSLSFFDPKKDVYSTVKTDPIILTVKQGEQKEAHHLGPSPLLPGARTRIRILGKDILPIHTGLAGADGQAPRGHALAPYLLVLFLPPCTFFVFYGVKRRKDRLEVDPHLIRRKDARKQANRELREARKHLGEAEGMEFHRLLSRSVKGLIGDKLNLTALAFTPVEIRRCLQEKGLKEASVDRAHKFLEELEYCQYVSREADPKQRDERYKEARQLVALLDKKL